MKKLNIFLTAIIVFLFTNLGFSHGIKTIKIRGGVGVKFIYADDSPVSFSDVNVFSPDGEEHQTGITDINGCFLFLPDTSGEWKIKIDDGMGHSTAEIIKVTKDFEYSIIAADHFPFYYKIIFGVCVIFGLGGILVLFRSRSYRKN